jgi:hypothetical protein
LWLALVFIAKQEYTVAPPAHIIHVVKAQELYAWLQSQATVNWVILHLLGATPAISIMEAIRLPTDNPGHWPFSFLPRAQGLAALR